MEGAGEGEVHLLRLGVGEGVEPHLLLLLGPGVGEGVGQHLLLGVEEEEGVGQPHPLGVGEGVWEQLGVGEGVWEQLGPTRRPWAVPEVVVVVEWVWHRLEEGEGHLQTQQVWVAPPSEEGHPTLVPVAPSLASCSPEAPPPS